MNNTIATYLLASLFIGLAFTARGEKTEVPDCNTLVVVGDLPVLYTQGEYPGYIDIEGSANDITSVWAQGVLTLIVNVMVNKDAPKSISICSDNLSTITLTGNSSFIVAGTMSMKEVTLSGTSNTSFTIPKLYADKIGISVTGNSSVKIDKVLGDELSVSALNESIAQIDGIHVGKVTAVAGDKSLVTLEGRCDEKNVVLIDWGTVDSKRLIESGSNTTSTKTRKKKSSDNKDIPQVNMP